MGDVFFLVKLQAMGTQANAELVVVKTFQECDSLRQIKFDAVVLDLESRSFDPVQFLEPLSTFWPQARHWAFAGHTNKDKLILAQRYGFENALSRGVFERRFPQYLKS